MKHVSALFLALFVLSASASGATVLVVGSDNSVSRVDGVRDTIAGTGQFTAVDSFMMDTSAPTLSQLQSYDAVLFYGQFAPTNASLRTSFGDDLADYVDSGGGVVLSYGASLSYLTPLGRFDSDQYWGQVPSAQAGPGSGTLTLVPTEAGHPILSGVSDFDSQTGASSFRLLGSDVHPNARIIAEWSSGEPLVVVRDDLPVVNLNFFAPSATSSSDADLLMANALTYTTTFTPQVPEPSSWLLFALTLLVVWRVRI